MTRAFTTQIEGQTPAHLAEQVDLVIPCYNAEAWIARTIRSARAQGNVLRQIIVVDDGSTDGSLEILRPLAKAGEITLLTGPNRGGCHARNLGLKEVGAPYVMFLDADDELAGPILNGAVNAALDKTADVVFSGMEIRYSNGSTEYKDPLGPPHQTEREIFETWFDGAWLGTCSVIWRSAFIRDLGGWDETLSVGQDGEMVMRALLSNARAARNDDGLGVYHRGNPGSVSTAGGVTEAKLAGQIALVEHSLQAARDKGWSDNLDRIYAALYFLTRKAFENGYIALGRQGQAHLDKAGHGKHHGTPAHNLVSRLIGLERKIRWFGSRRKTRRPNPVLERDTARPS